MIQVSTATNGVWEYTYNALGNRTTVIHDGVANLYLHDPIGLVDVAAEYDGAGGLVARYDHALGLVARTDSTSNSLFYAFDVIGNTRELTGGVGVILNSYDYDSFGFILGSDVIVVNPFTFVGRFGAERDQRSEYYMRARRFTSDRCRFVSPDPVGFGGGDENLYRYARNNPVRFVDPLGLKIWTVSYGKWMLAGGTDKRGGKYVGAGLGADSWVGGRWTGYIHGPWEISASLIEYGVSYSTEEAHSGVYGSVWLGSGSHYFGPSIGPDKPWGPDENPMGIGAGASIFGLFPLPPGMPLSPIEIGTSLVVFPRDPNDKIGPVGVGPDRLISAQDEMEYMIRFENHPTATAPVQELVVVDYLNPNLDWSTVEFGEIRYGDRVITVPAGQLNFSARDLPPTNSIAITGSTLGQMAVDMTATFNSQNGRLEWRLLAKDTQDNQFPDDALAGFLPPNNTNTHCGEGHLTFRVKPKLGLEIGTRIENKASIVFDLNDPIETPAVTNTIGQVEPKLGASIAYPASQMQLGMPFTMSLTVSNSGINAATNIVVTNAIPAGFTFVNATGTVGTVTYTNGNVVWTIGTLSNGFPATLTVTLLPTQEGNFVAPIRIRGGDGLAVDLDPHFTVQPLLIGIGTVTGGLVEVFAPSAATSYIFEVSYEFLGSPAGWQPITNVPTIIGDRQVITITPTNSAFFRLRKP